MQRAFVLHLQLSSYHPEPSFNVLKNCTLPVHDFIHGFSNYFILLGGQIHVPYTPDNQFITNKNIFPLSCFLLFWHHSWLCIGSQVIDYLPTKNYEVMKPLRILSMLVLLLVINLNLDGKPVGISYSSASWDEVLSSAKTNNQPIFVKTYASYCMPCKMMDKDVFPDPNVQSLYNNHFINFKVDMQSPLGDIFNLAYNVSAIPDLLFFSPSGEIILRATGGKTKNEIIELGNQALSLLKEDARELVYTTSTPAYPTVSFTASTKPIIPLTQSSTYTISNQDASNTMINAAQLPISTLSSIDQVDFITTGDFKMKPIKQLLKEVDTYYQEMSKQTALNRLEEVAKMTVIQAAEKESINLLKKSIKIVKKSDLPNKKDLKRELLVMYNGETEDWVLFTKNMKQYLKKTEDPDIEMVLEYTNKLNTKVFHPKIIKAACKWMAQLEKNYKNVDIYLTHAKLLMQIEQYPKAEKVVNKAIKLAKKQGQSIENCQVVMRQIAYYK